MQSYRTVSFGVRITPLTPVSDRAGYVRAGLIWSPFAQSANLSANSLSELFRVVAINSDEVEDLTVVWRRGDIVEAQDYRTVTSQGLKGSISIEVQGTSTDQELLVEIIHHAEYVPLPAYAGLISLETIAGSQSAASVAEQTINEMSAPEVSNSATFTAAELATMAAKIGVKAVQVHRAFSMNGWAGAAAALAQIVRRKDPEAYPAVEPPPKRVLAAPDRPDDTEPDSDFEAPPRSVGGVSVSASLVKRSQR
jgi:hypothetical protein